MTRREPSNAQVQRATALLWAGRALRYRKRATLTCGTAQCEWWRRFDDARHEALEHGALVGDHGRMAARVQRMIDGGHR